MMVGTRIVEEPADELSMALDVFRFHAQLLLERCPAIGAVLSRESMLHVAEARFNWWVVVCPFEARAGFGVFRPKRLQPLLRLPLEILEAALGRELPEHDLPPVTPEVR
jgi:hypothetical protein